MSTLTPIAAVQLAERLRAREIVLVDIREADEFAREHIDGSISLPLSRLEASHVALRGDTSVAFTCRTGMRTGSNCDRLAAHAGSPGFVLEGGLDAWKKAGLPVRASRKAPLEIMRQVQIAVGSIVIAGALLSATAHPAFIWLSALMGAGLTFAGVSGWCGMAKLLSVMPWNRRAV